MSVPSPSRRPIMHGLSDNQILGVWERDATGSPPARALLLLSAAGDGTPRDQLARLPIGRRDALLLALRERTFGAQLPCLATCPACHQNLEFTLDVNTLRASDEAAALNPPPTFPLGGADGRGEEELLTTQDDPLAFVLQVEDYRVSFRLPTHHDLAVLSPDAAASANRQQLLQACLLAAWRDGEEVSTAALPVAVTAAVVERMAELDPRADLWIQLDCPECGHRWESVFDIVSFLWTELHVVAASLLREVHELASAYGWTEAEILAVGPQRRRAYLEMLRS